MLYIDFLKQVKRSKPSKFSQNSFGLLITRFVKETSIWRYYHTADCDVLCH